MLDVLGNTVNYGDVILYAKKSLINNMAMILYVNNHNIRIVDIMDTYPKAQNIGSNTFIKLNNQFKNYRPKPEWFNSKSSNIRFARSNKDTKKGLYKLTRNMIIWIDDNISGTWTMNGIGSQIGFEYKEDAMAFKLMFGDSI